MPYLWTQNIVVPNFKNKCDIHNFVIVQNDLVKVEGKKNASAFIRKCISMNLYFNNICFSTLERKCLALADYIFQLVHSFNA